MKNKSAVSWYAQHEIELTLEFLAKKISELDYGLRRLNLLNQAKAMEKEQIINTFKDAQVFKVMNDETRAEQYYNQLYGK